VPGGGTSLDKLLGAWGLKFDTSKVVADRRFGMELGESGDATQQRPVWLKLTPEGINTNDLATAELDNIWYFSGGVFTGTPAPGLNETVLLKSTADSQLVDGILAQFSGGEILKEFKPSGTQYALAVRLTGKFKTAFPNGLAAEMNDDTNKTAKADASLKETKDDNSVVLVGDADMFYDGFTLRRVDTPFGTMAMAMNGNLSFAQNLVELFSGDNNLIKVRSRAVVEHPFTRLNDIKKKARARTSSKEKEEQDKYDKTSARLQELQQQKNPNQKYVISPEQQAEIDKLNKDLAMSGMEKRKIQKDSKKEELALQHKVEIVNIAAMPLVVIGAGVGLAIFKRKRNSAK